MNFKYYHGHQSACNILINFPCLMELKLLYLLMDWKTINLLPALEQVRGVIRALQTSMMVLLAKFSNVNLITITILAKRLILNASLGPGCASADGNTTVLKIQMIYRDERQVKKELHRFLVIL